MPEGAASTNRLLEEVVANSVVDVALNGVDEDAPNGMNEASKRLEGAPNMSREELGAVEDVSNMPRGEAVTVVVAPDRSGREFKWLPKKVCKNCASGAPNCGGSHVRRRTKPGTTFHTVPS